MSEDLESMTLEDLAFNISDRIISSNEEGGDARCIALMSVILYCCNNITEAIRKEPAPDENFDMGPGWYSGRLEKLLKSIRRSVEV